MFDCEIRVMLAYEYSTIWVNANLTCLLNRSEFLNPNITHLLNGSIVLIYLLDFIYKKNKKKKTNFSINQINMNYRVTICSPNPKDLEYELNEPNIMNL